MAYTKPVVLAENARTGVYAAGCGANNRHDLASCMHCSVSG